MMRRWTQDSEERDGTRLRPTGETVTATPTSCISGNRAALVAVFTRPATLSIGPRLAARNLLRIATACCFLLLVVPAFTQKKSKKPIPQKTPLDVFIEQSMAAAKPAVAAEPTGSLFIGAAPLADVNRDLRASQVGDVLTILVVERASSVTSGSTATDRTTRARTGFDGLFGAQAPESFLANLIGFRGNTALDAEGATSRQVSVFTTMSARVTHLLPNGALAIEGIKRIGINAEQQEVKVRGVIRPIDLGRGNTVSSDRIAQLEVAVNGEGIVAEAIKKPNFLVGILTKFLPF